MLFQRPPQGTGFAVGLEQEVVGAKVEDATQPAAPVVAKLRDEEGVLKVLRRKKEATCIDVTASGVRAASPDKVSAVVGVAEEMPAQVLLLDVIDHTDRPVNAVLPRHEPRQGRRQREDSQKYNQRYRPDPL